MDVDGPSPPFFESMRRMIGEVEGGLVHVEDPSHVAVDQREATTSASEQVDLFVEA